MLFRRLIFISFALICLQLPTMVSAAEQHCTSGNIGCTDDLPQWGDLGMENILAVDGQPNITPPSSMRLANNFSAGSGSYAAAQTSCPCSRVRHLALFRARWTRGYLYIIQCLRL